MNFSQPWVWIVAALAVLAVLGSLLLAVRAILRRNRRRRHFPGGQEHRLGLILNPQKVDVVQVTEYVRFLCQDRGWDRPIVLTTTEKDSGYGQTQKAIAHGCTLILVAGGDGTVREVAKAAMGQLGVSIALIPAGTGNLLARNLSIPLNDYRAAIDTAVFGEDKVIDVGSVNIYLSETGAQVLNDAFSEGNGPKPYAARVDEGHTFLVMSGLGFDATVMANTREDLKRSIGWWAYVDSGVRNFPGKRTKIQLQMDDRETITRKTRTIVVGNCGTLPANIDLIPEALVDDGILDIVSIAPKNPLGWARVAKQVLSRNREGGRIVEHFNAKRVEIAAEEPLEAEIDGDPVGKADRMELVVVPSSLTVRVPASHKK